MFHRSVYCGLGIFGSQFPNRPYGSRTASSGQVSGFGINLLYIALGTRILIYYSVLFLKFSQYFYQPNQNANAVITRAVPFQVTGDIAYIQGTNYVPKATGGLVAIGGGIGSTNATLLFESGVGEDLQFSILVFGSVRVGGL